jgi:hypothetical protein
LFVRGHCCLRIVYVWLNVPNIHFAQTKVTPCKKAFTNRTSMVFSSRFGFYKRFWTIVPTIFTPIFPLFVVYGFVFFE